MEYDSRPRAPKTVISTRLKKYHVNRPRIASMADAIKSLMGLTDYELHVAFVGSQAIRRLNLEFRDKDRSTDVLSFPQQEWAKPLSVGRAAPRRAKRPAGMPPAHLGDVVISLPDAARNAQSIGQGLDREVGFLMVHGILHLCGHDHMEPAEERRMLKAQRAIIDRLAASGTRPLWHACVRTRH